MVLKHTPITGYHILPPTTAIIGYVIGLLPPTTAIIGYVIGLLPPTTAIIGYVIGLRKLLDYGRFFPGTHIVVSLKRTAQIPVVLLNVLGCRLTY